VSVLVRAFPRIVSLFAACVVGNVLLRVVNRSAVDLILRSAILRDVTYLSIGITSDFLAIVRESFLKVVDFHYIGVSGFGAEASSICYVAVSEDLSDLVVVLTFEALFVQSIAYRAS
jgi:hypothetical protein